jgi:hypothetical protein
VRVLRWDEKNFTRENQGEINQERAQSMWIEAKMVHRQATHEPTHKKHHDLKLKSDHQLFTYSILCD